MTRGPTPITPAEITSGLQRTFGLSPETAVYVVKKMAMTIPSGAPGIARNRPPFIARAPLERDS